MRPPRWAERLLEIVLPEGLYRESVLGDLEEEHGSRVTRMGSSAARRWYVRQAVVLAMRHLASPPQRRSGGRVHGLPAPAALALAARQAVRSLRTAPGFVALATLTLAVGIGSTTAVFSVVDAVLLRPLPYPASGELVMTRYVSGVREIDNHSEPEYWDLASQVEGFRSVAAYRHDTPILGSGEPERIPVVRSTASLLPLLGVRPFLGRGFTDEEDTPGADAVVVLSHGLWTRALGADPDAIGRTVLLEERPHTIVGVMPAGFAFPEPSTEAWVPLGLDRAAPWGRNNHYLRVIARLAEGRDLLSAREELEAVGARNSELHPDFYANGMSFRAYALQERLVGDVRAVLVLLAWAVAGLLLIAAVNVAGLFLARGERRRAEIAVRTALGADRGRVAAHLLFESLVIAALGAGLGVPLAYVGVHALEALAPPALPRLAEVAVDARVLTFGLIIALATGLGSGLAPAAQAWRADVRGVLAAAGRGGIGGRTSTRLRRALVVAQLSLATALVLASAVLLRGVAELRRVDLGFEPEGTLVLTLSPAASSVAPDEDAVAFYGALEARLGALPGVLAVGSALRIPLLDGQDNYSVRVEGRQAATVGEAPAPGMQWATPGYFEAMAIPLRRGRLFTGMDDAGAPPVAVVNEALARDLWLGEEAVGKRLRMWPEGWPWMEVVGVVADVRHGGIQLPASPKLYIPHAQGHVSAYYAPNEMSVFVRGRGDPSPLATAVRGAIRELGPAVPMERVETMADIVDASLVRERFTLRLLALFSCIALVLGAVGVYGVVAQVVTQRSREIGLRMAVGAGRIEVAAGVLREGMALAGLSLGVGLAAGAAATMLVRRLLSGAEALDAWAVAATIHVLALAVAAASVVPAWRAARLDPVEALRER